ncbi:P-loop containing nucleoside triphosphate hydrolases superfamily protein [Perilla frutescens var. hirtella]|nr:P-loop containing nucleoside triphosphate hydrolases superfamily protein [Perilla frutescens var. hirtella]
MLAPEEVFSRKGGIKKETELTMADRKRVRAKKKTQFKGYWRALMSSEILKTMYGSGIKALDDLARELDSNSRSTFGWLNSEVSNHSSALDKVTNVEDQD